VLTLWPRQYPWQRALLKNGYLFMRLVWYTSGRDPRPSVHMRTVQS
jgi:hypothetical protein